MEADATAAPYSAGCSSSRNAISRRNGRAAGHRVGSGDMRAAAARDDHGAVRNKLAELTEGSVTPNAVLKLTGLRLQKLRAVEESRRARNT
jgi:hypothetical protein